jgi:signal transduction histidine kinase
MIGAVLQRRDDVEQFFRAINDVTVSPAETDEDGTLTVLCECAQVECTETLNIPLDVYEDIHRRRSHFAILPHHSLTAGNSLVEQRDEYWVVSRPQSQADAMQDPEPSTSTPARSIDRMLLDALSLAIAERESSTDEALDRKLATLREHTERARHSRRRYQFALHTYEQLMRHRIANPLTVICGVAETLRDHADLAGAQRAELLDALVEQARHLRTVVLDPSPTVPAEMVLEPWPDAALATSGVSSS